MNAVAKEALALIAGAALAGCAGWHRLEVPVPLAGGLLLLYLASRGVRD